MTLEDIANKSSKQNQIDFADVMRRMGRRRLGDGKVTDFLTWAEFFVYNPVAYTCAGTAAAIAGFLGGAGIGAIGVAAAGCLVDTGRYYSAKEFASRHVENHTNPLKSIDSDYYEDIKFDAMVRLGLDDISQVDAQEWPIDGTAAMKEGFHCIVDLKDRQGKTAKLVYKYNPSTMYRTPVIATKKIRKEGLARVPFVIEPFTETLFSNESRKVNMGYFYEFINGKLVARAEGLGETPDITAELDPETFKQMIRSVNRMHKVLYDRKVSEEKEYVRSMEGVFEGYETHFRLTKHKDDEPFLRKLDDRFYELMKGVPVSLVHNDLHPANMMRTEEIPHPTSWYAQTVEAIQEYASDVAKSVPLFGNWIHDKIKSFMPEKSEYVVIDWDNAGFGFPYSDFCMMAVASDFDRNPAYQKVQEEFQKDQRRVYLERGVNLTEEQFQITELETYLYILTRSFAGTKAADPKISNEVRRSCRYLLGRCDELINEMGLGKDEVAKSAYDDFVDRSFPDLRQTPYDISTSVAYIHRLNHERQKIKREGNLITREEAIRQNKESVEDCFKTRSLSLGYLRAFQFKIPSLAILLGTTYYLMTFDSGASNMHKSAQEVSELGNSLHFWYPLLLAIGGLNFFFDDYARLWSRVNRRYQYYRSRILPWEKGDV